MLQGRQTTTHRLEHLKRLVLLLDIELENRLEASLGVAGELRSLASLLTRNGDDTTDSLGDSGLLGDDKVLDIARLGDVAIEVGEGRVSESERMREGASNSRSTAELDTGGPPLGVGDIGHHLIEAVLESNDTNRVGVGLSKDGTKTRNLLSRLEVHLLGEDLDGLLDPLVRDALDLGEVVGRDGRLVREVETELGGSDEGTLLVDVVAEDLTESVVEDVSSGVVVAERPAAELV